VSSAVEEDAPWDWGRALGEQVELVGGVQVVHAHA
jgi:hypothetical protein